MTTYQIELVRLLALCISYANDDDVTNGELGIQQLLGALANVQATIEHLATSDTVTHAYNQYVRIVHSALLALIGCIIESDLYDDSYTSHVVLRGALVRMNYDGSNNDANFNAMHWQVTGMIELLE